MKLYYEHINLWIHFNNKKFFSPRNHTKCTWIYDKEELILFCCLWDYDTNTIHISFAIWRYFMPYHKKYNFLYTFLWGSYIYVAYFILIFFCFILCCVINPYKIKIRQQRNIKNWNVFIVCLIKLLFLVFLVMRLKGIIRFNFVNFWGHLNFIGISCKN